MNESVVTAVAPADPAGPADPVEEAFTRLEAELDALSLALADPAALTGCSDERVLDAWRRLERLRCRLPAVEHTLIGEVETRSLPFAHGARSTAVFAAGLLRLSPAEAAGRVRAAGALGARRTLGGQPLPPIFAATAAAQAAGAISARHAQVIVRAVEQLPDPVRAELDVTVEGVLLTAAGEHDPVSVQQHAVDLHAYLDPDGLLRDHQYREQRRDLRLHRRADGSAHLIGDLTPECAEHLHTHLDALTRPHPATPDTGTSDSGDSAGGRDGRGSGTADGAGGRDPRTAGQRRHDALLDILRLVERAQQLPNTGGITATILLTMDADTYATTAGTDSAHGTSGTSDTSDTGTADGSGTPAGFAATGFAGLPRARVARTGHGYLVPAHLAKRWAGAEARIITVLLTKTKAVTAYSASHRLYTEQQRLALIARDLGCSFPGCDAAPAWCQAHHVIPFRDSHTTTVEGGTLLCGHHHRSHEQLGWSCVMTNGRPHWIPPAWLDPQQTPRLNTRHR